MKTHKYSPNWYWQQAKCQIVRLPSDNREAYPYGLRLIIDENNKFVCFQAGFDKEIVLAIKIIKEDNL